MVIRSLFEEALAKGKQKVKSKYGHMKSAYTKHEAAELKKLNYSIKNMHLNQKGTES